MNYLGLKLCRFEKLNSNNLIYAYARHVIKGRWLEVEPEIMKSPKYWKEYSRFIDGREYEDENEPGR